MFPIINIATQYGLAIFICIVDNYLYDGCRLEVSHDRTNVETNH